jgi:hypothetical protein
MKKYFTLLNVYFFLSFSATFFSTNTSAQSHPQGCPISSKEELACGVLLCNPIGLVISKSRSECIKINKEWAIYLATLGPFRSPVRCQERDINCNKVGPASNDFISKEHCRERYELGTPEGDVCESGVNDQCQQALTFLEQVQCGDGVAPYCETLTNSRYKQLCLADQLLEEIEGRNNGGGQ